MIVLLGDKFFDETCFSPNSTLPEQLMYGAVRQADGLASYPRLTQRIRGRCPVGRQDGPNPAML